jgi:hypothetical protein
LRQTNRQIISIENGTLKFDEYEHFEEDENNNNLDILGARNIIANLLVSSVCEFDNPNTFSW